MGQPPIPQIAEGTTFVGKTVLVTGGNSGLGYEAARQYLVLGASRVILTTRTIPKGQEAASSLRAQASVKKGNPTGIVEFLQLDLEDYESVVAFTQKVKAEVAELDVLLLNGGMVVFGIERTKHGHEKCIQVNAYSNLIICLELLPLLQTTAKKRGAPSHLTVVGSGVHPDNSINKGYTSGSVIAHFDDEAKYESMKRYGDSKAAVAAFVMDLATRVPASEVIINHPCPGLIQPTGLDSGLPAPIRAIMLAKRTAEGRSVEDGSRTFIFATSSGPETHGKFLQHAKIDKEAEFLHTPAGKVFQENLWKDVIAEASKYDPTLQTAWS